MEEYSQAIEEERDYIGEQLKEVQNEVELERNKRVDLAQRLQELQEKVHFLIIFLSYNLTYLIHIF